MENWSWIEVVWTLVAAFGAYFSANNILDGRADKKALNNASYKDLKWKIQDITAQGNIRRDFLRLVIQGIFVGLGIVAGNIPSSPNGPTTIGLVFGLVLTFTSLLLTLSAVGDHNDRVTILEIGTVLQAKSNHVIK
jgi:hypothetical protein